TPAQLEKRLGAETFQRLFDEESNGIVDTDADSAIDELIKDSSAKVAATLRQHYPLDAVAENTPREVVRLTLDVAKVYAAQRYPEVVRYDWKDLNDSVKDDLKSLALGRTRLDVVGSPEPAANNGAH